MSEVDSPRLKRSWFALQYDEQAATADLYLYDDIGMWGTTANDFKEQLLALKTDKLNIFINSNGGEIDAGLAIYNMLKRHTAKKTIYIDGIAASMASVIAMAGDQVIMPETALMFVHKPWTIAAGNADDLQQTATELDKWEAALVAAYTSKTGLDAAFISEMLKDERLLSAAEAVEMGFADTMSEHSEKAAAYRGAITSKVLCHLAKRVTKEKAAMPEPEPVVVEEVKVDEPIQPESVVSEPAPEPVAVAAVDPRAEFKAWVDRFGPARAAAYFAEGLTLADAEHRFTDELIAENDALRAKQPANSPVAVAKGKRQESKSAGDWKETLAKHNGDYVAARKANPDVYSKYMNQNI